MGLGRLGWTCMQVRALDWQSRWAQAGVGEGSFIYIEVGGSALRHGDALPQHAIILLRICGY